MYSVAVMPLLLAVGWRVGAGLPVRWGQALGFLLAAVLLLLWENLSNDLFDADTGSTLSVLTVKQCLHQYGVDGELTFG